MTRESDEKKAAFYFSLVGIGYLFPFSAMTQPADYWKLLFPSSNIIFAISAVFMYTNLVLLSVLVFSTKDNTSDTFRKRIFWGFGGQLIALVVVPSLYFLNLSETLDSTLILLTTGFMALVTALLDSSVIALAGCFPSRCQESLQVGVGLSTLIGCVYRVVTKVSFPPGDRGIVVSSLIYFYAGALTIGACIFAFVLLLRLSLTREVLSMEHRARSVSPLLEEEEVPLDRGNLEQDDARLLDSTTLSEDSSPFDRVSAFRKSLSSGLSLSLLFFTTLSTWPALITEIPTYQFPSLRQDSWWSLLLLSLFAVFDVVGRFTVSFRMGVGRHNMWILVALRLLFIPVLVMCVRGVVFTHDAWPLVFVMVLGWTNGWCGSLLILFMTECGDTEMESRFIGTLASFYLNGGLVLGSTVGLLSERFLLG